MQHGDQPQAWSVHVRRQQHWVAELQPLHHQCLRPQSRLRSAWVAALLLAIAQEGSCEPCPRLPSDFLRSRVPKPPPRLLFLIHRAHLLIASCAPVLLDFGVPDVRARTVLSMQSYCTRFLDNLLLNKLLNLSRKHAVVKDGASVRVCN